MSLWKLILRSLVYHRRIHVAVALAVAVATAVLTGALLVGDSVRGSLTHLALDRLGPVDELLVTDRFFRRELAAEVEASPGFHDYFSAAVPAIVLEGSLKNLTADPIRRAGQVTILGCDDFAALDGNFKSIVADTSLKPGEVILNEALASELAACVDDEVLLRIGRSDQVPADSPLGRKTETTRSRRLVVRAIAPDKGVARFSLGPTQQLAHNAFVARATLAKMLEIEDRANAIFVTSKPAEESAGRVPDAEGEKMLGAGLHPKLTDYGFSLEKTPRGYWLLDSQRLLLDPGAERAALKTFADDQPQPAFTYLANTLRIGKREIPYSTVTAIDFSAEPPLGPFKNQAGEILPPLGPEEIALNSWAAEDLGAKVGDEVELVYFEPESTHGQVREATARFRLAAVVPLEGAAGDRHLTPTVKGVTDQKSIGAWNPPFPFDASRVRRKDEKYWDDYRATPKAFISLATGQKLWKSRFGEATSIRLAPGGSKASADDESEQATTARLVAKLRLEPADFSFAFRPVRRLALSAATGTTPFDVLFLLFSIFVILAAVMLIALVFGLGVQQRAAELGLLEAVGFRSRRVLGLLLTEELVVALGGSVLGVAAGLGYAALMLAGLRTWWLAAISTPFLSLYVTPRSLAIGLVSGLVVAGATIAWSLRQLRTASATRLLAGQASAPPELARRTSEWRPWVASVLLLLAIVSGLAALGLGAEAQAGTFFASGMLMLVGLLLLISARLRSLAGGTSGLTRGLWQLVLRNIGRNPTRAALSIGLIAAASFLILATSAFRLDVHGQVRQGTGGYELVAETDQPIYHDLSTSEGREELSIDSQDDKRLSGLQAISLRVRPGDDASCLNLYQPAQPRVLGLPQSFIDRDGFAWAASAATTPAERANPWLLLDKELPADNEGVRPVPVVLDMNTALYSLRLWKGVGETYEIQDAAGQPVRLQVVGLLNSSIFQGDLLVSEQQFLRLFPETSGYRFFLMTGLPSDNTNDIAQVLEGALEDYGFDAQPAATRLEGFLAVQNTYLSTFQSLGALGLLLGTFGLAAVQLRSVLERRGELALLQVVGFRRRRLAKMVLLETTLLLVTGLGVGTVAALVALLPHLIVGAATMPWISSLAMLLLVLASGLMASLLAVRAVMNAPLIPALRAE